MVLLGKFVKTSFWGQQKNNVALVEESAALTQDRNLSKEDVATQTTAIYARMAIAKKGGE